jgi:hypothetical protein
MAHFPMPRNRLSRAFEVNHLKSYSQHKIP